jgi:prevent-host-death family protein
MAAGTRAGSLTASFDHPIFRTQFRTAFSMASITVQDLKQALASVLERVGRGEWVTVLRHGKPVARLGPPGEAGLHVGDRFGTGYSLSPAGKRLTRGAWLDVLAEDRSDESRA